MGGSNVPQAFNKCPFFIHQHKYEYIPFTPHSTTSYPIADTVKSLNNRHFGARPAVRYSGYVLYSGVIVVPTFNIKFDKTLKQ